MPLDATLLELLACPSDDHAALAEQERDGVAVLVCSYCASSFPIEDGIPVLLLDEASPGPNGIGVAATPRPPVRPASAAPRPSATDHEAQYAYPPVDAVLEPVDAAPEPVDAASGAQPPSGADVELPVGAEPEAEPALREAVSDAEPEADSDEEPEADSDEEPEAVSDVEPEAVSDVEPEAVSDPEPAEPDPEPEHDHLDLERPMASSVAPTASATAGPSGAPAPSQSAPGRPTPVLPALQQARTRVNQLRRLVQDRVEERVERGPDGRPRLKRRGSDS